MLATFTKGGSVSKRSQPYFLLSKVVCFENYIVGQGGPCENG